MITSDEAVLAGGRGRISNADKGENNTYYLYTGSYYWTLSPSYWIGGYAGVYYVYSSGNLGYSSVDHSGHHVRPVVSLKAGITYTTGDGTPSNPYVIATA